MLTCCSAVACCSADVLQRRACLADEIDAGIDLFGRCGDTHLDVLGGLRRALRQSANFGCDHREAFARIAGASRLDTRIECEKIGLEGDAVDHRDDFGNFGGAALDAAHSLDRAPHHLA